MDLDNYTDQDWQDRYDVDPQAESDADDRRAAAKRIENRWANGDQPDPLDLDLFPVCHACLGYRLGADCPSDYCVYGRTVFKKHSGEAA